MGKSKSVQAAHIPSSLGVADESNPTNIPPNTSPKQASIESKPLSLLMVSPETGFSPSARVCVDAGVAAPSAPDDDGDTFYDALGSPLGQPRVLQEPAGESLGKVVPDGGEVLHHVGQPQEGSTRTSLHQHARHDPGSRDAARLPSSALSGRGRNSGVFVSPSSGLGEPSSFGSSKPARGRGPSVSVATPPDADLAAVGLPNLPSLPSVPCRKGLFVGINYRKLPENRRLKYAVQDARVFGQVLSESGFPDENLVFITDEKRPSPAVGLGPKQSPRTSSGRRLSPDSPRWQRPVHREGERLFLHPTRWNIIEGFRWLVSGAKEGDHLVWLFSGHCAHVPGRGPCLITANVNSEELKAEDVISKEDIRNELVLRVPKGCFLDIFLDCCFSSALVDLQYCVGRMNPPNVSIKTTRPPRHVTAQLGQVAQAPAAIPADVSPDLTSLPGNDDESVVEVQGPVPVEVLGAQEPLLTAHAQNPATPLGSFAPVPPSTKLVKPSNGITAACTPVPPTASNWMRLPTWIKATAPIASEPMTELAGARRPTAAQISRPRYGAVEAPDSLDYLEERRGNFDRPEGYVTVWAATGERQKAFEASKPAGHGILTNTLCKILRACKEVTVRELWGHVQHDVGIENESRRQRDLCKDEKVRQAYHLRTQHAEIWASHPEPLHSAALVLDRWALRPVARAAPSSTCASTT